MAEPARKIPASGQDPGNIIDFNQYKRNLNQARRQDRTEPQIADQYKQGSPMEGVAPSYAGASTEPEQKTGADKIGATAQRAGQAAKATGAGLEAGGKGLQRAGQAAEPIAGAAGTGIGGALGGAAAGARTGAQTGAKTGQAIGQGAAKGVQATDKGIGKTGKGLKDTGKKTINFARRLRQLGRQGQGEEGGKKGVKVDTIGKVLFFFLLCFAVLIDLLPFISAGLFSFVDWIFDFAFYFFLFIVLFVVTGDIFGSLIGKKGTTNMIQTVAEFIPGIDILPLHVMALILIYVDLQYNIFSGLKKLAKLK